MDVVATEVVNDHVATPQWGEKVRGGVGIYKRDVFAIGDLRTEIIAAGGGGVETEGERETGEVVDKGAAVRAETCAVAHNALGIETYDGSTGSHDCLEKCLNTKRTMRKLRGTAMANTAKGAKARLRPTHRKALNSTMCIK